MALMMTISMILTIVNTLLLIVLIGISVKNYQKVKAQFNLALLLFTVIFFLQKLYSLYVYYVIMSDFAELMGGYLFVLEILQSIAFSIYLWISIK